MGGTALGASGRSNNGLKLDVKTGKLSLWRLFPTFTFTFSPPFHSAARSRTCPHALSCKPKDTTPNLPAYSCTHQRHAICSATGNGRRQLPRPSCDSHKFSFRLPSFFPSVRFSCRSVHIPSLFSCLAFLFRSPPAAPPGCTPRMLRSAPLTKPPSPIHERHHKSLVGGQAPVPAQPTPNYSQR